jgi:pimeloyl-ACP methyl ester carboxylesterase
MNAALSVGMISGFRSQTITVEGVWLHYRIGGDPGGQPVILRHGFLPTGYAWREVAPALARAGMPVMIRDMRGYGDSDEPTGNDGYDGRALAEECRALAANIGFGGGKPILLAAHDMRAPLAPIWAADRTRGRRAALYRGTSDARRRPAQGLRLYTGCDGAGLDVVVDPAAGAGRPRTADRWQRAGLSWLVL